jgi:hypothetical protein
MEVILKLSVDEVNTVLRGVSTLSIAEAGLLHNKIFTEAQSQIPVEAVATEPKEEKANKKAK